MATEIEIYTPVRRAEFLLSNATSHEDYENAKKEVRKMGLDPEVLLAQCLVFLAETRKTRYREK